MKSDANYLLCPYCGEYQIVLFADNGGVIPSNRYDLLADTVWHKECLDKAIKESAL